MLGGDYRSTWPEYIVHLDCNLPEIINWHGQNIFNGGEETPAGSSFILIIVQSYGRVLKERPS